jgi:hypothetical protein
LRLPSRIMVKFCGLLTRRPNGSSTEEGAGPHHFYF